jgi:phage terminase large subunit
MHPTIASSWVANVSYSSYESALREAGYKVAVVLNQGKGAAAARIEAARRLFPQLWFDAGTTEAGREALGWY